MLLNFSKTLSPSLMRWADQPTRSQMTFSSVALSEGSNTNEQDHPICS